jgi:small subunit ribosomal protein S9
MAESKTKKAAKPAAKKSTAAKAVELKVPQGAGYGTGKRKNAIAKVWLFEGSGDFVINKKTPEAHLKSEVLIKTALEPLTLLGLQSKYNIKVSTLGGGLVGQADAIKLGIARALLTLNEAFRDKLKENGLVTRDARVKERKKYGRKKARKGYQFRKR